MRKYWTVIIFAALFAAAGTSLYAQETAESPAAVMAEAPADEPVAFGGIVIGGESVTLTVEAVDEATRTVTLKNSAGEVRDVICGPKVKNFAQIKKGDIVTLDVFQMAEVTVLKDIDAFLSREASQDVKTAQLGEKPAATFTTKIKVMAVVEDINYENRTVVLKGPEHMITVEAGEDAVNFDKVKIGDNVSLEIWEEVDIAVTTPAQG